MPDPFVTSILNAPYLEMRSGKNGKSDSASSEESLLAKRKRKILEMIAYYQKRYNLLDLEGREEGSFARRRFFMWHSNAHADGVISVFGGRGSGKTTLLLNVCAALFYKNNRHIVLPPILPERFGPGDTLAGWVFTYLKLFLDDNKGLGEKRIRWLTQSGDADPERREPQSGEESITLLEYLEYLRRQETLFSHRFARGLAEQNLWAAEYSQEASILLDADVSFVRHWDRFLETLFRYNAFGTGTGEENRPLLVIMIDDADLNPSALPGVIHQLRLLAHRHVLFLFSADRKTLHQAMQVRELDGYGDDGVSGNQCRQFLIQEKQMDFNELNRLINVRLLKALPKHNMLDIPKFTEKERLEFVPIKNWDQNGDVRFIDLLNKFKRPYPYSHPFMETLAHYFDFGKRICAGCCPCLWEERDAQIKEESRPCGYRRENDSQPGKCAHVNQIIPDGAKRAPMKPEGCRKRCVLLRDGDSDEAKDIIIPSPTVAILPDAVRGMEQLYFKIEALAQQLPDDENVKKHRELFTEAVKSIITVSMEYYSESISVKPRVTFLESKPSDDSEQENNNDAIAPPGIVDIDLSNIEFKCDKPSDKTFLSVRQNSGLAAYGLRLGGRLQCSKVGQIKGADTSEQKKDLSNQLAQAILFTMDMTDRRQLFTNDTTGGLIEQFLEHNRIADTLGICVYKNRTDNVDVNIDTSAWMTPRWPKAIDVNVFSEGWNFLRGAAARRPGNMEKTISNDWFWDRYLLLVSCIQSGRCLPKRDIFAPEGDHEYFDNALKTIRRVYRNSIKERRENSLEPRKQAFITWFNNYLPFFASAFHYEAGKAKKLLTEWFQIRLDNLSAEDISAIVDYLESPSPENAFDRMITQVGNSMNAFFLQAATTKDNSKTLSDSKLEAFLKKVEENADPDDMDEFESARRNFSEIVGRMKLQSRIDMLVGAVVGEEYPFKRFFSIFQEQESLQIIMELDRLCKNSEDDQLFFEILNWASNLEEIELAVKFFKILRHIRQTGKQLERSKSITAFKHARKVLAYLQNRILNIVRIDESLDFPADFQFEGGTELLGQAYRRHCIFNPRGVHFPRNPFVWRLL